MRGGAFTNKIASPCRRDLYPGGGQTPAAERDGVREGALAACRTTCFRPTTHYSPVIYQVHIYCRFPYVNQTDHPVHIVNSSKPSLRGIRPTEYLKGYPWRYPRGRPLGVPTQAPGKGCFGASRVRGQCLGDTSWNSRSPQGPRAGSYWGVVGTGGTTWGLLGRYLILFDGLLILGMSDRP